MSTATFPPNWLEVLQQIDQTLVQAIEIAQTREAALRDAEAAIFPVVPDLLTKHFEGLSARVRYVEQPLQELERAFQGDEEHVRAQLARFADLRDRLSSWIEE